MLNCYWCLFINGSYYSCWKSFFCLFILCINYFEDSLMNKKFEQDLFDMEISVTLYMSLLSLLINLMHSCWIKAEIKMFYIYCVKYLNGSASQFPQKYKVFLVLIIRNVSWVLKQHYDDNFWRIMWHWRLAAENPACHHRNTFNFEIY